MKFNIKVDEDFYEKEELLTEYIKEKIEDRITSEVVKKIFNDVYINITQRISDRVDTFITDALESFMDRKIVITDGWGNKTEEYESANELLEKRFDDFMAGRVDSKGKTIQKGCSYDGQDSRIQHIIDKTASVKIDKFSGNVAGIVDNKLKKMLKGSLEAELTDTIFKNIDVKKLFGGY